jgi:hypothetical protein
VDGWAELPDPFPPVEFEGPDAEEAFGMDGDDAGPELQADPADKFSIALAKPLGQPI